MPNKHLPKNYRSQQICFQPRSSAINMTLPAFVTKHRAAAPLLLGTCTRPPLSTDIV